jgi:hypothetical protein
MLGCILSTSTSGFSGLGSLQPCQELGRRRGGQGGGRQPQPQRHLWRAGLVPDQLQGAAAGGVALAQADTRRAVSGGADQMRRGHEVVCQPCETVVAAEPARTNGWLCSGCCTPLWSARSFPVCHCHLLLLLQLMLLSAHHLQPSCSHWPAMCRCCNSWGRRLTVPSRLSSTA